MSVSAPLRGVLRENVPMSRHTSWRAGGVAQRMYQPADLADLQVFLAGLPVGEPIYVVGLGSNLLVRDGGLRGTVLLLHACLTGLRIDADGLVYVEAGVAGAKFARFAALNNLRGAEFFAGIPGTMGGMLAMNAGCYGGETWAHVQRVLTLDVRGVAKVRSPEEYEVGYRHVALRERNSEIFAAAWLKLPHGDGDESRAEIKALLSKRISSQPLNLPNAGSVFRNPEHSFAARLIQDCGLKGKRIGDAQVSEKHANFIVNLGNARAADIEQLILEVQRTVAAQTGVELVCEVRIVGEPVA